MKTPTIKKNTLETIKTVVIAVLITAIVSFVAGMHYKATQVQAVNSAVANAQTAQAPVKK